MSCVIQIGEDVTPKGTFRRWLLSAKSKLEYYQDKISRMVNIYKYSHQDAVSRMDYPVIKGGMLPLVISAAQGGVGTRWADDFLDWINRKQITINGLSNTTTATDDFSTDTLGANTSDATYIDWDGVGVLDVICPVSVNTGNGDIGIIDLTSVSDTKAIIDFQINFISSVAGATAQTWVGVGDQLHTTDPIGNRDFYGLYIERSAGNQTIHLIHTNGSGIAAAGNDASFTDVWVDGDIIYARIIRKSATEWEVILYSDIDRTEVIGVRQGGTLANTTGCRYFTVGSRNSTGGGFGITLEVDNLKHYDDVVVVDNIPNEQTRLLDDNFSGTDDWTDTNTQIAVNVGTDVIDWNGLRATTDQGTFIDIGLVLSETTWTMHADFKINNITPGTNNAYMTIGISDDTVMNAASSQDHIGLMCFMATGAEEFYAEINNELTLLGNNPFTLKPVVQTYYLVFQRLSSTLGRCALYSDSARKELIKEQTIVITTALDNLRYVKMTNFTNASGPGTGTFDGTIDNIKVWNNVIDPNPAILTDYPIPIKILGDASLQRKTTETVEDKFVYASQGAADAVWVPASGSPTFVDIVNEELDWTVERQSQTNANLIDLTSVSDTQWTIMFDWHLTDVVLGSTSGKFGWFGLFSSSTNDSDTTTQDAISMLVAYSSSGGEQDYRLQGHDGNILNSNDVTINFTKEFTQDDRFFVTMRRLSATLVDLAFYADSARTILLEKKEITVTSAYTGLRYFGLKTNDSATTQTGTAFGTLKNFRFWDGVVNPINQEVATLDDDFTSSGATSHTSSPETLAGWTAQDHTKNLINGTSDRIDINMVADTTNDNISYDLEQILGTGIRADDINWCLRWKLHSTTITDGSSLFWTFGLSKEAPTVLYNVAHDFIGLLLDYTAANNVGILDTDNAALNAVSPDATQSSPLTDASDYYFELVRLTATTYRMRIFSDAGFSIQVGTDFNGTCSVDTDELRYITLMNVNYATGAGTHTGWIDDVQFWNGITTPDALGTKFVFTDNEFESQAVEFASEMTSYDPINGDWIGNVRIPSLTTNTNTLIHMYYNHSGSNPDYIPKKFIDKFSDDLDITGDWVKTGTLVTVDDVLADKCRYNALASNGTDRVHQGLGFTLGRQWICEWDFLQTAVSGSHNYYMVSLCAGILEPNGSTQDGIMARFTTNVAANKDIGAGVKDGSSAYSQKVSDDNKAAYDNKIYFTMIRDNDNLRLVAYSNSIRTTVIADVNADFTENIKDLNTIILGSSANVAGGTLSAEIDNIRIWNNKLTAVDGLEATWDSNHRVVYNLQGSSIDSTGWKNDGTDAAIAFEQQNNIVGIDADGADTKITVGSDISVDNIWAGGGQHVAWIDPKSDGEGSVGAIFDKSGANGWTIKVKSESAGLMDIDFLITFSGTDGHWETTNTVIPVDVLTKLTVLYNGDSVENKPTFIINGVKFTVGRGLTETTKPTGTRDSDGSDNLVVANVNGSSTTFDGFIGRVRVTDNIRPSSEAITSYNGEKKDQTLITVGGQITL